MILLPAFDLTLGKLTTEIVKRDDPDHLVSGTDWVPPQINACGSLESARASASRIPDISSTNAF